MNRVAALARFLWDFIVGDDWRIAAAVVVALGATALVGAAGWWILPLIVSAILTASVFSVARRR